MPSAPLSQSADRLARLMAALCAQIVADLCRQSLLLMLLVKVSGLEAWLNGLSDGFASLLAQAGAPPGAPTEVEAAAPAIGAEAGSVRRQRESRADRGRARTGVATSGSEVVEFPGTGAWVSVGCVQVFGRVPEVAVVARVGGSRDPPCLLFGGSVFSGQGNPQYLHVLFVTISE